jgi:hypothetical protein
MKLHHAGRVKNSLFLKFKQHDMAIGEVFYSEILGGCILTS